MKRLLYILCLLALPLCLSGCAGIYANTREVEDLLVIETMGLDNDPAGVRLTLASGAGVHAEGSPLRLEGRGPSITAAIERIRSLANEEELFCAHISHVLIGEAAAQSGIDGILTYICRSPELRISVPLYVLRGGEAGDAVLGVGNERYGVCDALDSVNGDVKLRGDGHVYSAADVAQDLARQGSALICAVDFVPSAEKGPATTGDDAQAAAALAGADTSEASQTLMTVAAAGYGVLKEGKLCAWIDRELAVGVGFLTGQTGPCELIVTDRNGTRVTLSLERGGVEVQPVWDEDGALSALEVSVKAEAAVAESPRTDSLDDGHLQSLLEAALSERLAAVLQLSKRLEADFLGLGSRVEMADPLRFRALEQPFPELLRALPLRLSVSARLVHSNDVEDARP